MDIAILLFDNYTALDVVGPYDVLNKLPKSKVLLVGKEKRMYKDAFVLAIQADCSIDEIKQADVLLIPGGFGTEKLLSDQEIINWIKAIDKTTQWTTSVCSGALLLAEAGLLTGKNCTTHWRKKEQLSKYNVSVNNERYVQDGKIITSAGVSAGIDMALFLVSKIAGEQIAKMIQLAIEYDPKPPFDYNSLDKVRQKMLKKIKQ